MGEVIKFETREMLHFGKLWRRFWRKLPPDQKERALRHMKKLIEANRCAADSSSPSDGSKE